jgi:ATP-dependent DNA helicase RecG
MTLLTESELRSLLAQEEGQYLEFKSVWDRSGKTPKQLPRRTVRDTIAEVVGAFANADGGTLVIGVEDDGSPTGHPYPEEAVVQFLAVPERRLRPGVRTSVQRCRIGNAELLVFEVPLHAEAVMVSGNGFPYRVGDQIVRETQEVINERKAQYRRIGFERQTRPEARVEDLDLGLVASFLAPSAVGHREPLELLKAYGLVVPQQGEVAITNAALLLFGRRPFSRWHPRAGLRLFRVEGSERRHGKHRNVSQLGSIEPPLALAIAEARASVSAQIRRSEVLHSLFFREMPEYPEFAWQEALVNGFAHREYAEQGREIEVWMFDDRMEILSPGDLVPPVTLEDLRGRNRVHASRNPLLARVLVDAGIMREEGEGIPRIHEEMEESFLRPPEFGVSAGAFTVALRNTPVFEGPSDEWLAVVSQLSLSANQRRALLAHPSGFTNEDYRALSGVDRDQAYREITEMVELGVLLRPPHAGRGAIFRPSPSLRESVAWLEQRVPGLRGLLAHSGRVTNSSYRARFSVTRHAAARELKRLVDEDLLRMDGEKRGAHYLPGPKLTAK